MMANLPKRNRSPGGGCGGSSTEAAGQQLQNRNSHNSPPVSTIAIIDCRGLVVALRPHGRRKTPLMDRMYRLPALKQLLGLSRTRIFELVAEEKFPRPIKASSRAIAWLERDLDRWQQAKVAERDPKRRRSVRARSSPASSALSMKYSCKDPR